MLPPTKQSFYRLIGSDSPVTYTESWIWSKVSQVVEEKAKILMIDKDHPKYADKRK